MNESSEFLLSLFQRDDLQGAYSRLAFGRMILQDVAARLDNIFGTIEDTLGVCYDVRRPLVHVQPVNNSIPYNDNDNDLSKCPVSSVQPQTALANQIPLMLGQGGRKGMSHLRRS